MNTKEEINKLDLYIDIANELNLKPELVKSVCEFQFESASSLVRNDQEEAIKFPYIGYMYKK